MIFSIIIMLISVILYWDWNNFEACLDYFSMWRILFEMLKDTFWHFEGHFLTFWRTLFDIFKDRTLFDITMDTFWHYNGYFLTLQWILFDITMDTFWHCNVYFWHSFQWILLTFISTDSFLYLGGYFGACLDYFSMISAECEGNEDSLTDCEVMISFLLFDNFHLI